MLLSFRWSFQLLEALGCRRRRNPQYSIAFEGNDTADHDIECGSGSNEIVDLFRQKGLPIGAAEILIAPEGKYAYTDLASLLNVTLEDLHAAGLKISPARTLLASLKPGGDVYSRLIIGERLGLGNFAILSAGDEGNPNDGSSSSDKTSSSGNTTVEVPRRVSNRIPDLAQQLTEQHRLAEACEQDFSTLHEARSYAADHGLIEPEENHSLQHVNQRGNAAKHNNFHANNQQHRSETKPSRSTGWVDGCPSTSSSSTDTPGPDRAHNLGRMGPRGPIVLDTFLGDWVDKTYKNYVHVNSSYKVRVTSKKDGGQRWLKLSDLGDGRFECGKYKLDLDRSDRRHITWYWNRKIVEWERV